MSQRDEFEIACRRQARVTALLQSYKGERITTAQICEGLRIKEESPEHVSLIWLLVKMLEYQQVSHDRKAGESVWWIEPKRAPEPTPEFHLRHVKAVVRSKEF